MFGIILLDKSLKDCDYGTYICLKLFKTNQEAMDYVPTFVKKTEEENEDSLVNELPYDVKVVEYEIEGGK